MGPPERAKKERTHAYQLALPAYLRPSEALHHAHEEYGVGREEGAPEDLVDNDAEERVLVDPLEDRVPEVRIGRCLGHAKLGRG